MRSCTYCEHALVTLPVVPGCFGEEILCKARNNLYVLHPILRALACRGFRNKHRLQEDSDEAR